MRILMCAFVALLWTGVAHAGDFSFMTGNQLLAFCKDPVNRVTCVAYVEAVSDARGAAALAGLGWPGEGVALPATEVTLGSTLEECRRDCCVLVVPLKIRDSLALMIDVARGEHPDHPGAIAESRRQARASTRYRFEQVAISRAPRCG